MNGRTIEVIVHSDGSLAVNALGLTGTDCLEATAFLEAALGGAVCCQKKPEYNRRARIQNSQKQGHGRVREQGL